MQNTPAYYDARRAQNAAFAASPEGIALEARRAQNAAAVHGTAEVQAAKQAINRAEAAYAKAEAAYLATPYSEKPGSASALKLAELDAAGAACTSALWALALIEMAASLA